MDEKEKVEGEKNSDKVEPVEEKKKGSNQGYAIAMGAMFGVTFGIIFDDVTMGIVMGLCFAMAFGLGSGKKDK